MLVDFWEYTCINCLKTLPYEKAWYERYRRYGFTIVGVHTPEFKFAGVPRNVAAATARLGIGWPVALDSNDAIWNRYGNQVWPHEYLVDASGRVTYDYEGEGDYPDMERRIQSLLRAAHPGARFPAVMGYLPQDDYAKPGSVCYPHTPELYAGDWRGDGALGNGVGYDAPGRIVAYADAASHDDGRIYLQGLWKSGPAKQAMVHARTDRGASDYVALRYHAIQVVAVLKPENALPVTVYVDQDGKPVPKQDAGADIRFAPDGRTYVVVDAPREYDLVVNRRFGSHELHLRPVRSGLGVYSFDFESCQIGADR